MKISVDRTKIRREVRTQRERETDHSVQAMKPILRPPPAAHRFSATVYIVLCILSICQASHFDLKASGSSTVKPGACWNLEMSSDSATSGSRQNNFTILFSARRTFTLTLSTSSSTSRCIISVQHVPSSLQIWTLDFLKNSGPFPAVAEKCSLEFGKDGNLMFKEGDELLWESTTGGMHVQVLELLENGNLILRNEKDEIVWESFERPYVNSPYGTVHSKAGEILKQPNEGLYVRRFLKEPADQGLSSRRRRNLAFKIVFPVAAFVIICIVVFILKRRMCSKSRKTIAQVQSIRRVDYDESVLLKSLSPELPPRFTYSEMHQATNGFEKKLGAGAYGTVFEGVSPKNGSKIAVKVFQDIENPGCRQGFCAEVMAIGSITHRNLVPLRGFCVEDDYRMLVYELMANGSLDKVLFAKRWDSSIDLKANESGGDEAAAAAEEEVMGWEKRRAIAIGSARALAFLHDGGERTVIHCDVKPENILLDDKWQARVSDFGLSKLIGGCSSGEGPPPLSKSGGIRGTLGYVAPEWRKEGGPAHVTGSVDVYSFGVVLLEIIAGRKCAQSGKSYLPGAAFDLLAAGGDLAELLDERLLLSPPAASLPSVRTFAEVALWCIQEDPDLRPSMASVLAMLSGGEAVSSPPVCRYYAGSSHFFDDHPNSTTTSTFDGNTSTTSGYSNNSWQISFLSGR